MEGSGHWALACGGSETLGEEGSGICGEGVGMETHQVKPSVNSTRLPLDHLGPGAGSYIFKPEKRVCFHTKIRITIVLSLRQKALDMPRSAFG